MKKKTNGGLVQKFNVFDVIIYVVLILFACLTLYPFIYTLAGSLNDAQDLMYGPIWFFPRQFTWASYKVELKDVWLYRSFLNTVLATGATLVGAMLLTSCVAYAMANRKLKGRKFYWYANLITMFINGGMIPSYMLIVLIGLYDSFWVYILPALYSVYNMIVLQNFFRSIDVSLYEAAVLDGANEFRIWLTIYLPISKPAIATVGLWIVVARWNAYMPTMLYTNKDKSIWLLQYYLMRLIREGEVPAIDSGYAGSVNATTLSFAAIIISSLPILLAYPFISRFFSKGIMVGSLKG
ncbi:MAG: carbohydrate ABC transporter permease [Candidatus Borkfalkiaceae bacterium]|nr:carbohydrate ABC transporter permease [Clostridia bacterium]MDY6222565.1 carbohydrate ABC transporter permease [Christensenellaceae bacterium]